MKRLFITSVVSLVAGLILGLVAGRRLPPSGEQVESYLNNLSVGEFSNFAKRVNAQLGFHAFPERLLPGTAAEPSK